MSAAPHGAPGPDLGPALAAIARGGVLVYPTETLYALGGDGTSPVAAARVCRLKGRDPAKPLPLVLAGADQLALVTDRAPGDLERLGAAFWPGPLSVLVPALPGLPPEVRDARGLTSVRVTPHPLAARLCRESGRPLIATSANLSGLPPTADPAALDPDLAAAVDLVLAVAPRPGGGAPSTVVACLGSGALAVHREGAVTVQALREAGFSPRPA